MSACLPFEVRRLQPKDAAKQGRGRNRRRVGLARASLEIDRRPDLGRASCAWFIFNEWNSIRYFGLGDTDDNMRMHAGARTAARAGLVRPPPVSDEPSIWREHPLVAAGRSADRGTDPAPSPGARRSRRGRWAVAIAPLLPYLLLLFSLALTARRLIDPRAYPLAFVAAFFAGSTNGMFMPERIDHHGWQLALLALSMAGMADPKRVRGGLTLEFRARCRSRSVLEMLIYIAIDGCCDGAILGR